MKTALIVGGAAIGVYIIWKLVTMPTPAADTSAASASAIGTSSMTEAGAQNTISGPNSLRGLLPLPPSAGVSWRPQSAAGFGAEVRSVLAAQNAPAAVAPAPSSTEFQVTGIRGVNGTAPAGEAPRPGDPSPLSLRAQYGG